MYTSERALAAHVQRTHNKHIGIVGSTEMLCIGWLVGASVHLLCVCTLFACVLLADCTAAAAADDGTNERTNERGKSVEGCVYACDRDNCIHHSGFGGSRAAGAISFSSSFAFAFASISFYSLRA